MSSSLESMYDVGSGSSDQTPRNDNNSRTDLKKEIASRVAAVRFGDRFP